MLLLSLTIAVKDISNGKEEFTRKGWKKKRGGGQRQFALGPKQSKARWKSLVALDDNKQLRTRGVKRTGCSHFFGCRCGSRFWFPVRLFACQVVFCEGEAPLGHFPPPC